MCSKIPKNRNKIELIFIRNMEIHIIHLISNVDYIIENHVKRIYHLGI